MDEERIDWSVALRRGEPILTAARARRKDVVAIGSDRGGVEYRSLADPLDTYVACGNISERQYEAAITLRAVWHRSNRSPFAQSRHGDSGRGGLPECLPVGIWTEEYRKAIGSIRGEREREMAHGVCCEYLAASRIVEFKSRRTAQRRGMIHLKSALDQLAAHFRIR